MKSVMALFVVFICMFIVGLIMALSGCGAMAPLRSMSDEWCDSHPTVGAPRCAEKTLEWQDGIPNGAIVIFTQAQSWDQGYLKQFDSREGCGKRHGIPLEIDGLYVECQ